MSKTLLALTAATALAAAAPATVPGPLSLWGTSPATVDESFVALADGGTFQTLALRVDRTLYLTSVGANDTIPGIPDELKHQRFRAIGMGRNHALGVREDGGISAWGLATAFDGIPSGRFSAVTGGGQFSVALRTDGHVVVWGGASLSPADYHAIVGVGAPSGVRFTAIAARGRYVVALGADGRIYGWGVMTAAANVVVPGFNAGWTSDEHGHYVAPDDPGNPYTAIAAGLDHVSALRADGSIVVWDPTGLMAPPPAGSFTRIASSLGYSLAIDTNGSIYGWGVPGRATYTLPPSGTYSEIAAGTGRASAIARH